MLFAYPCVCVCVCRSKSSKPRLEKAVAEHIYCVKQHTTCSDNNKETSSDFCLNFCAGQANTNVAGVQQIKNLGEA